MEISTFNDDLFELEDFSRQLDDFISTEHDYVEGSLVIALTSKYGSGKTTFLEMWKSSMSNSDNSADKPLVISLNAWESDYCGDPLFAIISALIECLEINGKQNQVDKLVNAAKNLGLFVAVIGNQLATKMTGIDMGAASAAVKKKEDKREQATQTIPDTFSVYQSRKSAMESLKCEIKSIVAEFKPRVLFLVDELDRCRPDYAIAYLETIKHIFDIKGAVFLLAADRQQLENSAKMAFGQDLDFEEYYRKFIHREITLPKITDAGYEKLAHKYVTFYTEREEKRYCYVKFDDNQINNISKLIGSLKLTPRQIQEVFRILGHILSTSKDNAGHLRRIFRINSIIMSVFKVGNPEIFHTLGSQELKHDKAMNYLKQILDFDEEAEWYFLFLLHGGGIHMNKGETKDELIKHLDLVDLNENFMRNGQNRGFERRPAPIAQIYKRIEQISQWG